MSVRTELAIWNSAVDLAKYRSINPLPPYLRPCAIQRTLNGHGANDPFAPEEIIPDGFEHDAGNGNYYHAGNLVLTLLATEGNNQDCFGLPVTTENKELLACRMGVTLAAFQDIWEQAILPTAPQDVEPEREASRRTTYRMCLLRKLLTERSFFPAINRLRDAYLTFFRTHEVWKGLPQNIATI